MVSPKRQWNVVAGLAIIVVLAHFGAVGAAFFMGKIDGLLFKDLTLPVITAVLGYFAAMLGRPQ